ncbi:hypothetical protein L1276_003645 [Flavobacterium sp. HSC-32F16]|nr:hypothetical protein [Flavobacterium sp. HSC-32F16]MCP2028475.1 hypothetical protein [Flavobacterium sp. HSC-32F16]
MRTNGSFIPKTWESLTIDKAALSQGELYTIVTNKKFKGKKAV